MRMYSRSQTDSPDNPVQTGIEAVMTRFIQEDRWDHIILFSQEGLVMARAGTAADYGEDRLLEFAFTLLEAVRLLKDSLDVQDIVLRGSERKRLIFRYFPVRDSRYILAAVSAGRKGYRRAFAHLIKRIREEL